MRFLLIALLIFASPTQAWEASDVHLHYSKWEGVLGCPYGTLDFEIRLNPENDDPVFFELKIGGAPIQFSEDDFDKLQDLELGTMRLSEELYRSEETPCEPQDGFEDWVYISLETGPEYRISWEQDGKTRYQWGKDILTIMVTMGTEGSIRVSKQVRH